MNDIRLPKLWRDISEERKKRKKRNPFSGMDTLKKRNDKKFSVTEEVKMDWWDKFLNGLKEGRITIWFWIIIILAMTFVFSVSTVKIDFNIDGDIDYKHPKIFQPKDAQ